MEKNFNLQKFIISVVIIGIVLVLGIYITSSIGIVTNNSTAGSGSYANESGFLNNTGYTLAHYSADNFTLVTTVILNATSNATIGAGNYTITNGVLKNATATTWPSVKISYSFTTGHPNTDDASLAADEVTNALATGTDWISILVVVGFAVIILTMLTQGLGSAAGRVDEVPYY